MLPHDTRVEIENIVAGAILKRSNDTCAAIRNSICNRFATSGMVKKNFESNAIIKKEQSKFIEDYFNKNRFWRSLPIEIHYFRKWKTLAEN